MEVWQRTGTKVRVVTAPSSERGRAGRVSLATMVEPTSPRAISRPAADRISRRRAARSWSASSSAGLS
jgi:hypothetical protein